MGVLRLGGLLLLLVNASLARRFNATHHMLHRPSTIPPNTLALLNAASFVAELSVPPRKRSNLFALMGTINDVPDEVLFYSQAAKLPGVRLVGEVGFNAGHSAIALLTQKAGSALVSFDLDTRRTMPWSAQSLAFLLRRAWPQVHA